MDWMDDMAEAGGDITRGAIADIGDSYQEILMSDASISPPDGLTGDIVTVTDTVPQDPVMSDAQLQSLVDVQQHEMEVAEPVMPQEPELGG
jgi:hypothetical protein